MDRRHRPRATLALAVAAGLLALAGCGGDDPSDEEQIAATVRGFLTDVYRDGNFEAACERLAPAAQGDLVNGLRQGLPNEPVGDCEDALTTLQSFGGLDVIAGVTLYVDAPRYTSAVAPDEQRIGGISIDGDKARARVGENPQMVQLRRIDGEWKVARLVEPKG